MFYICATLHTHCAHTPNNFRYLHTESIFSAVLFVCPVASAFVNEMQAQTYFVSYTLDWLKINQFFKYEP